MTKYSLAVLLIIGTFFLSSSLALASTTTGTIDSSNKYVWSENVGWIDFGSSYGNVQVTDTALTGYAWSDTVGWINLAPSGSGVVNDSSGNLSGYAWGENVGWIDFSPTGGGVTIDSTGVFSGYAWGENIGWLVFNCSTTASCSTVDYKVTTDYLPAPYRGGGSILTGNVFSAPTAPTGGFQVSSASSTGGSSVIVGGLGSQTLITNQQEINFNFKAGDDTKKIAISNNPDFKYANLEKYDPNKKWKLTDGYGKKRVYVKFYNAWGYSTEPIVVDVVYAADGQNNSPKMADNNNNDNNSFFPDGSLVKEIGKPAVYRIENGQKRPIVNGEVFEARGYRWQDIKEVASLGYYKLGYTIDNNSGETKKIAKSGSASRVLGRKVSRVIPTSPPPANYPEPTSGPNNKVNLLLTKFNKFSYGLGQGMADQKIRGLQILLASQPDIYPSGKITGYFGPLTKEAVQKFQLKYNIIKNNSEQGAGYVGPKTRQMLNSIFGLK